MKRLFKKILSICIATTMSLSTLCINAFAESQEYKALDYNNSLKAVNYFIKHYTPLTTPTVGLYSGSCPGVMSSSYSYQLNYTKAKLQASAGINVAKNAGDGVLYIQVTYFENGWAVTNAYEGLKFVLNSNSNKFYVVDLSNLFDGYSPKFNVSKTNNASVLFRVYASTSTLQSKCSIVSVGCDVKYCN